MHRPARFVVLALAACFLACTGGAPARKPETALGAPEGSAVATPAPPTVPSISERDAVVPIAADDPVLGANDALVTMVEFADFECPYCARASVTLERLVKEYGPSTLRVVFKHEPLSIHPQARSAGEAAAVVHALGGNGAFWSFYRLAYAEQSDLGTAAIESWVSRSGVSLDAFHAVLMTNRFSAKVERDHQLATTLRVSGTPSFYINGTPLVGAQPYETFKALIDAELAKAKDALANGVSANELYRTLAARNFKYEEVKPDPPEDTTTVWRVPVGTSPTLGPATALVTIIQFGDFQCPYCKMAEPALETLRTKYGNDVRFVWKNEPLPSHERAEPAARFAIEARAQKGETGFWAVHDRLFALPAGPNPPPEGKFDPARPDDADFDAVARAVGLDLVKTHAAVANKKYQKNLDDDADLVDDFDVRGTPQFFINGRRLVGAQPIDRFVAMIDEEMAKAKGLLQRGIAPTALYDELLKDGRSPAPPERRVVAFAANAPFRGVATAPVTIVAFSDLQCPFCRQAEPTLIELLKNYAGKVRIEWRNYPLTSLHLDALVAAEAAMEVYKQKGNDAFWRFHDKSFAAQDVPNGLKREALERYAAELGVDLPRFKAALDTHSHKAEIDAEAKVAIDASFNGTPTFLVNGYVINGAQPYRYFARMIDRALADAAAAKKKP